MASYTESMSKRAIFLSQIGLAAIFLVGLIPFISFVVDDAFISFVYSKNLIAGNGLTYNGIIVEGFSNPLWTLVFAPIIGLGIDPLWAARVISIISGIICMLLIFELSQDIVRDDKLSLAFLSSAAVSVLAPFLAWTMGGLETIFLSFLITSLTYIEWKGLPQTRWLSPVLLLAIALTRPEGVMVFIIWLLYRALHNKLGHRTLMKEALLFIAPFLAILLIRWLTFGYLLPNTAYVKVEPSISISLDALRWLVSFLTLRPLFGLVLLFGTLMIILEKPFDTRVFLPLGITLSFIAFVIFSGRDWMPHHRFIAPIIPLLALPITAALKSRIWPKIQSIVIALTILSIGFEVFMTYSYYKPLSDEFGKFTQGLIQAGKWIESNTEEEDTIAVVDAGALAYFSERKTIDILGLNDVHIAHSHPKSDSEYVLDYNPTIIQLHVSYSKTGELNPPTDTDHNLSMIENERFLSCYRPDIDRPSDPFYPYLFFRDCE